MRGVACEHCFTKEILRIFSFQAATSVATWLLSLSFLRIFLRRLSIAERSPLMLR